MDWQDDGEGGSFCVVSGMLFVAFPSEGRFAAGAQLGQSVTYIGSYGRVREARAACDRWLSRLAGTVYAG